MNRKQKPMLILLAGGSCSGKNSTAEGVERIYQDSVAFLDTDDFFDTNTKFTGAGIFYKFESIDEKLLLEKTNSLLAWKDTYCPIIIWSINQLPKLTDVLTKLVRDPSSREPHETEDYLEEKLNKLLDEEAERARIEKLNPDLDKVSHTLIRRDNKEIKKASPVIIIGGCHPLQSEKLRKMADLKVFMHTDDDIRLILKIRRSPYYKRMVGQTYRDWRNYGRNIPSALSRWINGDKPFEAEHVLPTKKHADLTLTYNHSKDFPKNVETLLSLIDLYQENPEEFPKKIRQLKENKGAIEELVISRRERRKKLNCLHCFIKEQVKLKGRKIKIIADWDDCLQPVKPMAIYKGSPEMNVSFKSFFEKFWETAIIKGSFSGGGSIEDFQGTPEEQAAVEKFVKERAERRQNPKLYSNSFYSSPERFEAPLTSIAEELLKCLKEDLISELVLVSSFRKPWPEDSIEVKEFLKKEVTEKQKKMKKVFGDFPHCKIEFTEISKTKYGKYSPYRWEILQNNHPDFDIYIDDDPNKVMETLKNLPDQDKKVYVLPDYKNNRSIQAPNIYHVKTSVSDLTDEDFVQAAAEYRAKHANQSHINKSAEPEKTKISDNQSTPTKSINYTLWVCLGLGALALTGIIAYFLVRKKNKE